MRSCDEILHNRGYRTALDGLGKSMELTKYTDRLVPSTRFVAVNGISPKVSEMSFVAPSASVIGDVTIGKESRYVNPESFTPKKICDYLISTLQCPRIPYTFLLIVKL